MCARHPLGDLCSGSSLHSLALLDPDLPRHLFGRKKDKKESSSPKKHKDPTTTKTVLRLGFSAGSGN
jgi:hypothetical protein